nr:hypothetical protein [bacterium]
MRYACCVLLAILSSAHVPAAPLSTSTLKASDLRSATAWLADVTSYEITLACTLSMPGFAYTIEMEHKALRPWYAETRLELPGFTRYYVCDNDSLWTSMPGMKTYTVEPWHGLAVSPDAAPTAGSAAMEPPYFFDFLRQVVVPEGDLEFEFESEGTLDMDGRPLVCEIWRPVSGSFAEKVDHVWIDPDRRIIMMTEGSAEDEKFGTVGFEFRVASLTLDGGLQPSDFEFTPEPGMTRVSASAKLLVGDSLEGEAAPAAEFRDLDGGTVSTSDWRGRVGGAEFLGAWGGARLKGVAHPPGVGRG